MLLTAVPHLELLELHDGGMCCGSAGTYNIDQPELAEQLGRRKAALIEASGAQVVASGNIGCLTQLRNYLPARIELKHTMQLLASAYGALLPSP